MFVLATNNTFQDIINKAIYINSNKYQNIQIYTNKMDNFKYGIYLTNNVNSNINVNANLLNTYLSIPLTTGTGNLMTNNLEGISIYDNNSLTNVNIGGNNIGGYETVTQTFRKGTKKGITLSNVKSGYIDANDIFENTESTCVSNNSYGWGIKCDNSSNITIINNNITSKDRGNWWDDGIRMSACHDTWLSCNYIYRCASCLWFDGSQLHTLITRNNMRRNYWGLVVNHGDIGLQAINNMPTDNVWVGPYPGGYSFYHTLCWGSSVGPSTIIGVRNNFGTPYYPNPFMANDNNSGNDNQIPPSGATINPLIFNSILSDPQYNCSGASSALNLSDVADQNRYISIAEGYYNGAQQDLSKEWWLKYNLYQKVSEQSELLNTPELLAFKLSAENEAFGKLEIVSKSIADTIMPDSINFTVANIDWAQIKQLNDGITTNNELEARYKEINDIVIRMATEGEITEASILRLKEIAQLCPLESGPGVYMARALVKSVIEDDNDYSYYNDCELIVPMGNQNSRMAKRQPLKDIGNEEDDYNTDLQNPIAPVKDAKCINVYPNPAQNSLIVSTNNNISTNTFYVLIDAQGKKLIALKAEPNNTLIDVSNIGNGLYLLQSIANGKVVNSQKITIIK